jgi:hypothetical protein
MIMANTVRGICNWNLHLSLVYVRGHESILEWKEAKNTRVDYTLQSQSFLL